MKNFLYCFICLAALVSLQGCFWHSSTTVEREVPADSSSSTTVVNPPASSSVTTTTNP